MWLLSFIIHYLQHLFCSWVKAALSIWCPLKGHTGKTATTESTAFKITRLDEGLEEGHCLCNTGKGDKEERKMGKGWQQQICPPELMLYVYETVRFPESESQRYTTQSNKKANRKNNCDNSILTFKPQPHKRAFVSGPDDSFCIKEVNTTKQGLFQC